MDELAHRCEVECKECGWVNLWRTEEGSEPVCFNCGKPLDTKEDE